jgi:hypothetical protein
MAVLSTEQTELEHYLRLVRVFLAGASGLLIFAVLLASIERPVLASIGFYSLGMISGILFIRVAVRMRRHHALPKTPSVNQTARISVQFDTKVGKRAAIANEDPLLRDCLLLLQRFEETRAFIHRMRTGVKDTSGRGSSISSRLLDRS